MPRIWVLICTLYLTAIAGLPLDLNFIFKYPLRYGTAPLVPVWSPNDSLLAFQWAEYGNCHREIWLAETATGKLEQLTQFRPEDCADVSENIGTVVWHPSSRSLYCEYRGDIWQIFLEKKRRIINLTSSGERETGLQIAPGGKFISYIREQKLVLRDLASDTERELTLGSKFRYRWAESGQKIALLCQPTDEAPAFDFRVIDLSVTPIAETELRCAAQPGTAVRSFCWSSDEQALITQTVSADLQRRWLLAVDFGSVRLDTLYQEHLAEYVSNFGAEMFCPGDDQRVIFGAEINGYQHLLACNLKTHHVEALTRGKWNVSRYAFDRRRGLLYFTGDRQTPGVDQVLALDLKKMAIQTISYRDGSYQFALSNTGNKIAEIFSTADTPPDLYWIANVPRSKMNRLTSSPQMDFREVALKVPQVASTRVAPEGYSVSYRMWLPGDNLAAGKYPLIVALSGAQALPGTREQWNRTNLVNQWLSEQGFIVVEVIYSPLRDALRLNQDELSTDPLTRQLREIQAVVQAVSRSDYVESMRIGVMGWGYGGYLAAMTLFKESRTFRSGAVLMTNLESGHCVNVYLNRITEKIMADSSMHEAMAVDAFYRYLGSKVLFSQGQKSNLPTLLQADELVKKILLSGKPVEMLFYPWEGAQYQTSETLIDYYTKVAGFFKRTL